MKNMHVRILAVVAIALGLALVLREGHAQQKPEAAPVIFPTAKTAVCDVVKLFSNYQRAKDLETKLRDHRNSLKKEDADRSKKIDSIESELKDLDPTSNEYQNRLDLMTKLTIDRETWIKFEEAKDNQEHTRMTEAVYNDVLKAVSDVAKDKGITLVLNSDDTAPESKPDILRKIERKKVLYADNSLDITNDVLARLNESYKAAPK